MIRPDYLIKGDRIAVISPSYCMEGESLDSAFDIIRGRGFEPVASPNLNVGEGTYAGSAQMRAADLVWALKDADAKAIICSRGGYGALHLIDIVPSSLFQTSPKWLVGYSDITTLHAMSVAAGVMSVHGPMLSSFIKEEQSGSIDALFSLLSGGSMSYRFASSVRNVPGKAFGCLMGGNFITLTALFGSGCDFLSADDDIILFVEEVEESMHAIDRLFNVLKIHHNFSRVKGLVFGQFTNCGADLEFEGVEQMLSQYLPELGIPVCFGFPAGHGQTNMPFIEGASVELTVAPFRTCLETAAADEGAEQ